MRLLSEISRTMRRWSRIARRWSRTHRRKYTFTLGCAVAIFCVCFHASIYLLLKRDLAYIARPLWGTPDGNFTLIHAKAYPVSNEDDARRRCEHNKWRYQEVNMQPRVIDAVIFSNELDMLEIRIRELWDVVDIFVIVEANRTFSGHPKPCVFQTHRARFQFAKAKIVTAVVTTLTPLQPGQSPFDNETKMRRWMNRFLQSKRVGLRENDLLIISDVDEIPRKAVISLLKTCAGWPNPLMLQMTNFLYSFEFATSNHVWRAKVRRIESGDDNMYTRARTSNDVLADAGWHCSFCFPDIEDIIFKMQAYSHVDRVTDPRLLDKDAIQKKICNGKDIFDMYPEAHSYREFFWNLDGAHQTHRDYDLPQWVLQNPDKFAFLLPGGCNRPGQTSHTIMQTKSVYLPVICTLLLILLFFPVFLLTC